LLVTIAAAWALPRGFTELVIGSVAPDGARHRDGTAEFYRRLDSVVAFQEGGLRVTAPAIGLTSVELLDASGVTDDVLAFAHSCHLGEYPCGACPGCRKHEDVIQGAGRFL
jgi:7-cyano-7-deazaguanine synthase